MTRLFFLLISFILIWQPMRSQAENSKNVRVLNFDQLEPYLHRTDDSVYLVNFWATWCLPCRQEMPAIQAVEKKYSGARFKVLLVSLDFPGQLEKSLIPYLESNKIRSEVVLLHDPDQNRWIDLVDRSWSGEIPYSLIYGKDFRESYSGAFNYEKLDTIINKKLYSK
jgi:thiol-disulfide isomerase/thioredoxin